MSVGRPSLLILLPALVGAWLAAGLPVFQDPAHVDVAAAPLLADPKAAVNQWGQHVPRRPEATSGEAAPVAGEAGADGDTPRFGRGAFVDRAARVLGDVELGEGVYVAPFASLRGDRGRSVYVGNDSNVQDGAMIQALQAFGADAGSGHEVDGRRFAVHIGERVSLAHQSQIHGPARVEDDVFVGMQALIFRAHVGGGSVLEPGARVIGVYVPAGRYVPAGSVITTQGQADMLPRIDDSYAMRDVNRSFVQAHAPSPAAHGDRP